MQDLYYDGDSFLHRLNPLSKMVAALPALLYLVLVTDVWNPLAFIILTVLVTIIMGRVPITRFLRITLPLSVFMIGTLILFSVASRPDLTAASPVLLKLGPLVIYQASLMIGLATALRVYAIILLGVPFTLTTEPSEFIRALIQNWKLPYRFCYGAMAGFRFVPMLDSELGIIGAAHKVRGVSDRGGIRAQYDRFKQYAVPLFATAIRHAERTALVMDSRAFGAFEGRTYHRKMAFKKNDWLFMGGYWAVSLAIIIWLSLAGLTGRLELFIGFN